MNQTYSFRWDTIPNNLGFLASGMEMTLFISAVTLVVATALGLVIALMQMSRFRIARFIALSVGEVVRNTPILVQLLWVYYVLPIVFNLKDRCADRIDPRPVALFRRFHLRDLQGRHPDRPRRPSRGGASARLDARSKLRPDRRSAGPSQRAAASCCEFRAAHQILLPGVGHIGRRNHAARDGAFILDVQATGDIHLHRDHLLRDLLAAHPLDPHLGSPPCTTLITRVAPFQRTGPAKSWASLCR